MVLGVPVAAMDFHFFCWRMFLQIIADVNGTEPQSARSIAVKDWPIKESPETALEVRCSEPTAVLAVRPGGD